MADGVNGQDNSWASLLVARGPHPRVLMEQLGHSTIKLTRDTYSHVLPERQLQAADTMDGLFGATGPGHYRCVGRQNLSNLHTVERVGYNEFGP